MRQPANRRTKKKNHHHYKSPSPLFSSHLVVVQLQPHAVVNLVVGQRDVVLAAGRWGEGGGWWGVDHHTNTSKNGPLLPPLLTLNTLCHFWMRSLSGRVPVWAATSFLRSPIVSSSLGGWEEGFFSIICQQSLCVCSAVRFTAESEAALGKTRPNAGRADASAHPTLTCT